MRCAWQLVSRYKLTSLHGISAGGVEALLPTLGPKPQPLFLQHSMQREIGRRLATYHFIQAARRGAHKFQGVDGVE